MAFTGLHIVCGFVGIKGSVGLEADAAWSETLSAPGRTTLAAYAPAAPAQHYDAAPLAFQVSAAADSFVAKGTAAALPDATQALGRTPNTARELVRGGETKTIFCNVGEFLSWTAA